MSVPQPPSYDGPCEGAVFVNSGLVWRWHDSQWHLCMPPLQGFAPAPVPLAPLQDRLRALVASDDGLGVHVTDLLLEAAQEIDDLESRVESASYCDCYY